MNVHCRLIEVNAASAASEHLSYLKGNGIANGSLMNCMVEHGEFRVLRQIGLALSVVYVEIRENTIPSQLCG